MTKKQKVKHDSSAESMLDAPAPAPAPAPSSSLSAFLLGSGANLSDDIFANSKGPSKAFEPSNEPTIVAPSKPLRSSTQPKQHSEDTTTAEEEESEAEQDDEDEDEDEDEDDVEQAYAAKLAAQRLQDARVTGKRKASSSEDEQQDEDELEGDDEDDDEESGGDDDDDDDDDEEPEEEMLEIEKLMQASIVAKQSTKKPQTKTQQKAESKKKKAVEKKKAHADETPEERDARTLFIGNVPVACSTNRPLKKKLIRHLLTAPHVIAALPDDCPALKCDAIRFRSIAFASKVFGRKPVQIDPETGEQVDDENHARKRARAWRNDDDEDLQGSGHGGRQLLKGKTLTDSQKRKVAFIKGDLNENKAACNAYLVLDNLPDSYTALTMDQILDVLVKTTSGSTFEGKTLRGDRVRPKSAAAKFAAAQTTAKPDANVQIEDANAGPLYSVPPAEARRTVFVGGLDFAEQEENVRAAVEAVLVRERGSSEQSSPWVENVRIIRDASSGLGKGFGYVLLKDDSCVDELLALPDGKKLKVSKRKVRLERCKTQVAAARAKAAAASRQTKGLPGQAVGATKKSSKPAAPPAVLSATPSKRQQPVSIQNRDPSIRTSRFSSIPNDAAQKKAEQLASLSKEQRKAVKSTDAERLARRAQKKQAKVLKERHERKMANAEQKGGANAVLGRQSRREKRDKQEKKRVAKGNKTGKRAKF
ncbi:Nucleolar protein 12 [Microbotryomycetes sp. JL201]|nr:Nucleolar protein 12 [Microbotryomycetes sp. JL201]